MSMACLPSCALPIMLKKSVLKQHGGTRTSLPTLVADLNDHEIELSIIRYVGTAHIYVYDADNTSVLFDMLQVSGNASKNINLMELPKGNYVIKIILDDESYVGTFSMD